jgi:hypothetical protein
MTEYQSSSHTLAWNPQQEQVGCCKQLAAAVVAVVVRSGGGYGGGGHERDFVGVSVLPGMVQHTNAAVAVLPGMVQHTNATVAVMAVVPLTRCDAQAVSEKNDQNPDSNDDHLVAGAGHEKQRNHFESNLDMVAAVAAAVAVAEPGAVAVAWVSAEMDLGEGHESTRRCCVENGFALLGGHGMESTGRLVVPGSIVVVSKLDIAREVACMLAAQWEECAAQREECETTVGVDTCLMRPEANDHTRAMVHIAAIALQMGDEHGDLKKQYWQNDVDHDVLHD